MIFVLFIGSTPRGIIIKHKPIKVVVFCRKYQREGHNPAHMTWKQLCMSGVKEKRTTSSYGFSRINGMDISAVQVWKTEDGLITASSLPQLCQLNWVDV